MVVSMARSALEGDGTALDGEGTGAASAVGWAEGGTSAAEAEAGAEYPLSPSLGSDMSPAPTAKYKSSDSIPAEAMIFIARTPSPPRLLLCGAGEKYICTGRCSCVKINCIF
jgi:hypothetical protein